MKKKERRKKKYTKRSDLFSRPARKNHFILLLFFQLSSKIYDGSDLSSRHAIRRAVRHARRTKPGKGGSEYIGKGSLAIHQMADLETWSISAIQEVNNIQAHPLHVSA